MCQAASECCPRNQGYHPEGNLVQWPRLSAAHGDPRKQRNSDTDRCDGRKQGDADPVQLPDTVFVRNKFAFHRLLSDSCFVDAASVYHGVTSQAAPEVCASPPVSTQVAKCSVPIPLLFYIATADVWAIDLSSTQRPSNACTRDKNPVHTTDSDSRSARPVMTRSLNGSFTVVRAAR